MNSGAEAGRAPASLMRTDGRRRGCEEPRRHVLRDLLIGAPRLDTRRVGLGIPAGDRVVVALVEQQPAVAIGLAPVRVAPTTSADEGESAPQLLAE